MVGFLLDVWYIQPVMKKIKQDKEFLRQIWGASRKTVVPSKKKYRRKKYRVK